MGLSRTGYLTLMLAVVALGSAVTGLLASGWAQQQWSSIVHQHNLANASTVGNEHSEGAGSAFAPGRGVSAGEAASFRQERNLLLMLGAMSYMYASLRAEPQPGYDISAVIAWDVDDPSKTPEIVFDRNRNYENQGDIYHAEINTLRTAYAKLHHFDIPPTASGDERYALYKDDFKNAVLYTTLEPCPMCATTITMARVSLAIFCMDDPGLRDVHTHHTSIEVPTAFYGRKLTEEHSELRVCREANEAMWRAVEQSQPAAGDPARASSTFREITEYIHQNRERIFRPAWDELQCYRAQYPEDQGLLSALQKATGDISCGK